MVAFFIRYLLCHCSKTYLIHCCQIWLCQVFCVSLFHRYSTSVSNNSPMYLKNVVHWKQSNIMGDKPVPLKVKHGFLLDFHNNNNEKFVTRLLHANKYDHESCYLLTKCKHCPTHVILARDTCSVLNSVFILQLSCSQRSYSFPPMNSNQRRFIHEIAVYYNCSSRSYDQEPKRNTVVTATRSVLFFVCNALIFDSLSLWVEINPKSQGQAQKRNFW